MVSGVDSLDELALEDYFKPLLDFADVENFVVLEEVLKTNPKSPVVDFVRPQFRFQRRGPLVAVLRVVSIPLEHSPRVAQE